MGVPKKRGIQHRIEIIDYFFIKNYADRHKGLLQMELKVLYVEEKDIDLLLIRYLSKSDSFRKSFIGLAAFAISAILSRKSAALTCSSVSGVENV